MYRRIVTLLLLPGFLLTQWASLGHFHGGDQPVGHDLAPHFHVNAARHDHHHGGHHHHGHGHKHHHHHDEDDRPDIKGPQSPEPKPLSDHDADAVYVSVDLLLGERCLISNELGSVTSITATPARYFRGWDGTQDHFVRWLPRPPRQCSNSCALYLQHLTILI